MLLVASSSSQLLRGQLPQGGSWTTSTFADGSPFGPSLTVDSTGAGVAVYTATTGSTVNTTIWSGGAWSTPASIAASAVARAQPFVDATGGPTAHVIYQDTTYKLDYLAHGPAGWTTTPLLVGGNYGPVPATIAALGANATAGFLDGQGPDTNYAASSDLAGSTSTWAARVDPGAGGNFNIPAVIIPLSAGPDVMMVYVQCAKADCSTSATQIMFLTRTAGTWTAPVAITNALTADRVALAPLPGGGAILAFRGTDTFVYWSTYSAGTWAAVAPLATPNVSVTTSPAVTHGIMGDTAEIAYLASGVAYHARLSGSTWSTPVAVGGTSLNGVAIASSP